MVQGTFCGGEGRDGQLCRWPALWCEGASMQIGVLKERRAGETRVAASPETVKKLIAAGCKVTVETGAGAASQFNDAAYQEAGAVIAPSAAAAAAGADVV